MNLPLLTAKIGEAWADDDVFSVLYQEPKLRQEENKQHYIVFLIFDLTQNSIEFGELQPYNSEAIRRYKYFGNNKAAAKQFHVVRESKDLFYLMGIWGNLKKLLKANELKTLFAELINLEQAGLINAADGRISLQRITYVIQNPELKFKCDFKKKRFLQTIRNKVEEIDMETFIRKAIGGNPRDQIVLVVPRIKKMDGSEVVISNHPDYLELIKRFHKLGEESSENKAKSTYFQGTCYICGKKRNDLACIDYSTKLRRDGINKIFTTTTTNYAMNIEQKYYEYNYSFCKDCFDDLRQGEKIIINNLSTSLAREKTFVLPEGLLKDFEYENISEIKREIDFVFKPKETEIWLNGIVAETRWLQIEYFNLNFVVYDTDGNSVTILQTIDDVNNQFFLEIVKTFAKHLTTVKEHLRYFSLGSIYHVIPVKSQKDGKQVDAGRVLSFYKSILKREQIKTDLIYQYALEALGKGLKQLASSDIKNYFNLELKRYSGGWEDFYVKKILFSYIVILQALQEIGVLTQYVFESNQRGKGRLMDEKIVQGECPDEIWDAEQFLEKQHFPNGASALFYLGLIMKRVVIAQTSKGHKNKPIFKKINFQGMSKKDILRFYKDLVEKLQQYNKINFYTEWLMNRFHYYMGSSMQEEDWPLSEHANVFFIMSGYAFQVGKKALPDLTTQEKKAIKAENDNVINGEEEANGDS